MISLTERQKQIIKIVHDNEPITGTLIANRIGLSKSTIRSDLSLLTHTEILNAKPKVGYVLNKNKSKENKSLQLDLLNTKVKEMKSKAVCIKEDMSLHDAIIEIFLHDAGTIFVTDEKNYLRGVVSRKDFLKSILGNTNIDSVPVSVIMTRMPNIIMTTDDETIVEAANKIMTHKIDALPVVQEKEPNCYMITGRISKTTVTKLFVKLTNK